MVKRAFRKVLPEAHGNFDWKTAVRMNKLFQQGGVQRIQQTIHLTINAVHNLTTTDFEETLLPAAQRSQEIPNEEEVQRTVEESLSTLLPPGLPQMEETSPRDH